ncbi:MAG TPA: ATP-binding protein [Actinomycetota bacterium]|nr:ATP-binding protein [Actinomycetota bacterium]
MDERLAQRILPAGPEAPGNARQFLAEKLAAWGERDLLAEAILALSELVTNAFLHGEGNITVRVTLGKVLRVAVHDSGRGQPAMRKYSATATTGRGLVLVDSLCDRWGTTPDGNGKWVWFEQNLVTVARAGHQGQPDSAPGGHPAAPPAPLRPHGQRGSASIDRACRTRRKAA